MRSDVATISVTIARVLSTNETKKILMIIARDTTQRSYSNDRMNATESRQAATRLTF